jgi:uncharacterized protein (DUF342 family)
MYRIVCVCVQVERQRDDLKADKDRLTSEKESAQQEWVTLKAELQKRDIQLEEMQKEVGKRGVGDNTQEMDMLG